MKPKKKIGAKHKGTVATVASLCIVCTVFITILFSGCKKNEDTAILLSVSAYPTYSVQLGDKPGEFDINCYIVVSEEGSNAEQQLELDAIEGFTFERGYEYLLKAKKVVNNDLVRYSLVGLVSKTKMNEGTVMSVTVSTEKVYDYTPEGYREIILLKEDESDLLTKDFYIEGFNYENGYEYRLKVHKYPPVKMPPQSGMLNFYIYSLIEIISKNKS